MSTRRRTVHLWLAVASVGLAALAAASGGATPDGKAPRDVEALELARWIRHGRPGLRVIDVRDAQAFEAFAIPGAERMTLGEVESERWAPGTTVVVYADDDTAASRARAVLGERGMDDAFVLRDGLAGWVRTIASPVLPANPSPGEAAASREIAEMSRWFGGVPRVGEPVSNADSLRAAIGRIRRRGC